MEMNDQQRMEFFLTADCRNMTDDELQLTAISLLKESRVNHVLGCSQTAVLLAKLWGVSERDAYRAGILHDVTKALPGDMQLALCDRYGVELDSFSRENPKTIHAITGAAVAQRVFGENEAVVSAIESHTTGKKNMNTLEKIIYIADYMEPNRSFEGVEELRQLAKTNLDEALKMGLEMSIALLREQGRVICPRSLEALEKENV